MLAVLAKPIYGTEFLRINDGPAQHDAIQSVQTGCANEPNTTEQMATYSTNSHNLHKYVCDSIKPGIRWCEASELITIKRKMRQQQQQSDGIGKNVHNGDTQFTRLAWNEAALNGDDGPDKDSEMMRKQRRKTTKTIFFSSTSWHSGHTGPSWCERAF